MNPNPQLRNKRERLGAVSSRGFTMVEVLISVGLLSIASLGVIGVLTFGVLTGDTAGNFSTATQLGREIIEVIRVDKADLDIFPPSAAPAGLISPNLTVRTAINAAPLDNPIYGLPVPAKTRFFRNIAITEVDPGFMARIQVRIYWQQNGTEKFVETVGFKRSGELP